MIVSRLVPVLAVFTLGLTACGHSLAPYPGFNSGVARPDYHHIVMAASAADRQTYVRDGRMHLVPGPMVNPKASDRADDEIALKDTGTGADTAPLTTDQALPIPRLRPRTTVASLADPSAEDADPELAQAVTADQLSPRLDVETDFEDLIDADSEIAVARQDVLIQAQPGPRLTPVTASPVTASPAPAATLQEAVAGLPLLASSTSSVISPDGAAAPERGLPEGASPSLQERLENLSSVFPGDASDSLSDSPILGMNHEELDILLVQLESEVSGYDRVRNMSPEEKAKLRSQYERRSFLGHFAKMDRDNDGALTREEMLAYFTIIHAAFDADYDDVVSRAEAPSLLLRIKLLGQGFPASGLTLPELQRRLEETFVFLDRNNNDKLGWPELL